MTTKQVKIEELTNWSEPKQVNTKLGPRLLRKGEATELFWQAWKSSKAELKEAGVSCGKDRSGNWEACWWLPLSEEEQQKQEQALEASRATDADIDIPVPKGLDYLPYQRAGIAFALKVFGD